MIKKIEIDNFKSFGEHFKVELGPFNVFIGPNGCGKTNFVDAFRFIKDSLDEGIGTASKKRFSWQGIRCRKISKEKISLTIEGVPHYDEKIDLKIENRSLQYKDVKFHYKLSFTYKKGAYVIVAERAQITGKANGRSVKISSFDRKQKEVNFLKVASKKPTKVPGLPPENYGRMFLEVPFFTLASTIIGKEIEGWRTYDPDPEKARNPHSLEDEVDITEAGDTLAPVLHKIKSTKTQELRFVLTKILSTMETLIPGFRNWETKEMPDGKICFWIREKAIPGKLPPDLISNGTIRLLTLLCGLLFERKKRTVVFIEEPELCLHPSIMEQLADLMREVSREYQIIITTHSADFVRHCRPGEVFLMDKIKGLTQVVKAGDIKQINKFLDLFSLDELWLQGYLKKGLPL